MSRMLLRLALVTVCVQAPGWLVATDAGAQGAVLQEMTIMAVEAQNAVRGVSQNPLGERFIRRWKPSEYPKNPLLSPCWKRPSITSERVGPPNFTMQYGFLWMSSFGTKWVER